MAIPPRLPTVVQVLEIAKSFGMTLTEEDAASFRGLMAGSIAPGSALSCLDELAGEAVETACEKAVFASPESVASAVQAQRDESSD